MGLRCSSCGKNLMFSHFTKEKIEVYTCEKCLDESYRQVKKHIEEMLK